MHKYEEEIGKTLQKKVNSLYSELCCYNADGVWEDLAA